jgi:hypothetical protein
MRRSGSLDDFQSAFETLLSLRWRSIRRRSSAVGFLIPAGFAKRVRFLVQLAPVSRRTIDFIAALASSMVESTPSVLPLRRTPFWRAISGSSRNTPSCTVLGSRCRMSVSDE